MINIDGEKMSKSLGNFKLAKDLINEHGGNVIRMCLLSAPYRSPVNFSEELINTAKMEIDKIINAVKQANIKLKVNKIENKGYDEEIVNQFLLELSNDLNLANGFTVLYDTVKKLNISLRSNNLEDVSKYYYTILEINKIISLDLKIKEFSDEELELYYKWEEYKKAKDFEHADKIRKALIEKGVL